MKLTIPTYDLYTVCDYIEYFAFLNDECCLYRDVLSDDADKDIDGINIDDVIEELERRLILYGKNRPYEIYKKKKVKSLFVDKENNLHYLYTLYYALYGGGSVTTSISNLFEEIVDNAVKNYLNTSLSLITSFGQNTCNLKNKIPEIRDAIKESIGNIDNMPKMVKDGGIDIITYKPLDDRGNQLIILTDATIGKNWRLKRVNHIIEHWREYIHFKVCPYTSLAIVHVVEPEEFHTMSKENGLIFDRCRIIQYFKLEKSIYNKLLNWKGKVA